MHERINVFAEEAKIGHECKRAAETFAMLQRGIGTDIHHELFREFGLGEIFTFAGFDKAGGHIVPQITFA